MTWRETVDRALVAIGGEGTNAEIYAAVATARGEKELTPNRKAKVRQTLQLHFYSVQKGRWSKEEPIRPIAPADVMLSRIRAMLKAGNALLHRADYDSDTRTVMNADVSIDGELRVRSISHATTIISLLLDFEELQVIKPIQRVIVGLDMPRVWGSIVLRYSAPEGVDSMDSRWRGLAEAFTNWVSVSDEIDKRGRTGRKRIVNLYATARNIDENMRGKRRKKAEQVLVRIYWDPMGTRPIRRGQ